MKKKILVFIAVIALTLFAFIPPKTAIVRADEEISSTYYECFFSFPFYVDVLMNTSDNLDYNAFCPYPFKLILTDTGFSILAMQNSEALAYNYLPIFTYNNIPNTSYSPSPPHFLRFPLILYQLRLVNCLGYSVSYDSFWMRRYYPNFSYVETISLHYDSDSASSSYGNIYIDFIFPSEADGSLNFSRLTFTRMSAYDSPDTNTHFSLRVLRGPLSISYKTGFSYLRAADVSFGEGFSEGYNDGKSDGETIGFNRGYARGFDDGTEIGEISFYSLISSLVDVPINAFTNLFNFNILGINLLEFMTGLLTLALVITIFRIIFR